MLITVKLYLFDSDDASRDLDISFFLQSSSVC